MENMKRLTTALAVALLTAAGAHAQNLQRAGELYSKGLYAEAMKEAAGAKGGDAEAFQALGALQLKMAGAEERRDSRRLPEKVPRERAGAAGALPAGPESF